MRATIFVVTAVLSILTVAVQAQTKTDNETVKGSGVIKSEHRDVSKFDALTLAGQADVDIAIGDKTEVIVETDDNLLPYIKTEVKENRLAISTKPGHLIYKTLKVTIITPSLSEVVVDGSGDVAIKGLKGDSFKAVIDGSGDVVAKGQVKEVKGDINGSGDLELMDLIAQNAKIEISGSGDVKVNAVESLKLEIDGSGDIGYKNNPNVKITKSINGSGEINPL
jgi:hypothetical protein